MLGQSLVVSLHTSALHNLAHTGSRSAVGPEAAHNFDRTAAVVLVVAVDIWSLLASDSSCSGSMRRCNSRRPLRAATSSAVDGRREQ